MKALKIVIFNCNHPIDQYLINLADQINGNDCKIIKIGYFNMSYASFNCFLRELLISNVYKQRVYEHLRRTAAQLKCLKSNANCDIIHVNSNDVVYVKVRLKNMYQAIDKSWFVYVNLYVNPMI